MITTRDARGRFRRAEAAPLGICPGCGAPVPDRTYRLCQDCADCMTFVASIAEPAPPTLWQRILKTLGW